MSDEKPTVVAPLVHGNGTSRESLLEARESFFEALDDALGDLRAMAPNHRDYYPAEPGRWEKAQEQHQRRMQVLTDLMKEIETECELIEAQGR